MNLRDLVKNTVIKLGKNGKTTLAAKAGLSVETVRKVIEGTVPSPKSIFALCKACGCTEEESMAYARENPSDSAKESA